jgi:ribose transport system ATP-binding protein
MALLDTSTPILEMNGITKRFPGVLALDHVNFSVCPGEIHAIIGQNGAGKSTLMKILSGVYNADEGTISIGGRLVRITHPREALQLGIGTVYQELSLLPKLTVADNIFLGREPGNGFVINEKALLERTQAVLRDLGITSIDLNVRVEDLPLAQQQLVEIAKVLSHELKILVLDEPTSSLSEKETAHLFELLKSLKQKGIAIIFVSHRFKEILQYCDRGTVLRNGKVVKTLDLDGVTEDQLAEMMIGQKLESFYYRDKHTSLERGEAVLEVKNLSIRSKVKNVNFVLYRGEIVGITGLLGAGQNELARALFGIQENVTGTIIRNGQEIKIRSPSEAIKHGICLLTENRKAEGLFLEMSVKENITLPSLVSRFLRPPFFINNSSEERAANEFIKRLNITAHSGRTRVRSISGGNQQKIILARWLLKNLDILIFIEPTRGIDVGTKAEIYQYLYRLAKDGKSIVVVSPELPEILGISSRIFVMYKGTLARVFDEPSLISEEMLLAAIQGRNGNGKKS